MFDTLLSSDILICLAHYLTCAVHCLIVTDDMFGALFDVFCTLFDMFGTLLFNNAHFVLISELNFLFSILFQRVRPDTFFQGVKIIFKKKKKNMTPRGVSH